MNKKWSTLENEFLIKQYPKSGAKYCADMMGRTISSVANKANILNLSCDFHPYWNKGI